MATTITKRLMIGLLALAGTTAFAATAQVADQPTQDDAAAQETTAQDANAQAAQDQARKPDINDRNCLRYTGSRIQPRADKQGRACVDARGNSYTRDDIDRTGEIDMADALRKLDVSIH